MIKQHHKKRDLLIIFVIFVELCWLAAEALLVVLDADRSVVMREPIHEHVEALGVSPALPEGACSLSWTTRQARPVLFKHLLHEIALYKPHLGRHQHSGGFQRFEIQLFARGLHNSLCCRQLSLSLVCQERIEQLRHTLGRGHLGRHGLSCFLCCVLVLSVCLIIQNVFINFLVLINKI